MALGDVGFWHGAGAGRRWGCRGGRCRRSGVRAQRLRAWRGRLSPQPPALATPAPWFSSWGSCWRCLQLNLDWRQRVILVPPEHPASPRLIPCF